MIGASDVTGWFLRGFLTWEFLRETLIARRVSKCKLGVLLGQPDYKVGRSNEKIGKGNGSFTTDEDRCAAGNGSAVVSIIASMSNVSIDKLLHAKNSLLRKEFDLTQSRGKAALVDRTSRVRKPRWFLLCKLRSVPDLSAGATWTAVTDAQHACCPSSPTTSNNWISSNVCTDDYLQLYGQIS